MVTIDRERRYIIYKEQIDWEIEVWGHNLNGWMKTLLFNINGTFNFNNYRKISCGTNNFWDKIKAKKKLVIVCIY